MRGNHKGYLCLVLHAHLPFIRHPDHEYFLEENWLYEAITETYIPLLKMFDRLARDGIDFKITMTISPPLASMLQDKLLQSRYTRRINNLIELSTKEIERTISNPRLNSLARMYNKLFNEALDLFNSCNGDLIKGFKRFQDSGMLEIITSAATHGYLPLMANDEKAVKAQINVGVEHYKKVFNKAPQGFWLPECGYCPGHDRLLKEAGVRYFFVDSHGVNNAGAQPRYGVYAPLYCASGVAAFGRDNESSNQVWSADEGYPGDGVYREFYRDMGHKLDIDCVKLYIHPDGIRFDTGIKYCRITGKTERKDLYGEEKARKRAREHAEDFVSKLDARMIKLSALMERTPVVTAPYDAELFGHWWFEGPLWLENVIRIISAKGQNGIKLTTPPEYLEEHPVNQQANPAASSWGCNGYNEVWLNNKNDYIYKPLNIAARRMSELADKFKNASGVQERALNQAAREILLAQSSDWAFIINAETFVEYANNRIDDHIEMFNAIYDETRAGKIDETRLAQREAQWNIFPDIDFRMFG